MLVLNRDALKQVVIKTGKLGKVSASMIALNLCFVGTWSEPYCYCPQPTIDYIVRRFLLP
jgi:hypothetical protein